MKAPSNSPAGGEHQAQPSLNNDLKQKTTALQNEGADYYVNEAGLVVFTERYLLERGYCCGNGCKHCPFKYEAVPEPKRSCLLAKRKEHEL